ncbi:MAG: hypothetical protein HY683_08855 [Chloroflexi bacterium]|nr:hypothetical protein [Chloroflexota bacterium]
MRAGTTAAIGAGIGAALVFFGVLGLLTVGGDALCGHECGLVAIPLLVVGVPTGAIAGAVLGVLVGLARGLWRQA